MPKGGLNPEWKQHQTEISGYHPVVSGVVFAHLTEGEGHGATMDVNTGDFVDVKDPSKDTYLVGKEPDTEGKPIPTAPLAAGQTFMRFPEMVRNIRNATGGREGASIGSWRKDSGEVDIDASAQEPDLAKAMEKARVRNEEAIWSTKKFRKSGYTNGDIKNPFYQPPKE